MHYYIVLYYNTILDPWLTLNAMEWNIFDHSKFVGNMGSFTSPVPGASIALT